MSQNAVNESNVQDQSELDSKPPEEQIKGSAAPGAAAIEAVVTVETASNADDDRRRPTSTHGTSKICGVW